MRIEPTDFGGATAGPVLLLGPSLGTTAEALWAGAAERLTDRFRVVGWDLPGHGRSGPAAAFDVPALATAALALADELGAGAFHYAGDSIGGAVGLQLLLDAPDRVSGATLICTGARIGEPAAWRERATVVRADGTSALLAAAPARWFAAGFAEREAERAMALLDALATADDESYAAACEALAAFDVQDRLAAVDAPVVAVAGADDVVVPIEAVLQLAAGVQRGRAVVLPHVGHLAAAEAPSAIADVIAATAPDPASTGLRVRREVLGADHVDRARANRPELTGDFQDFITRYAWGGIWTRPGLDRRSRSLITLTALVAGGHHEELALHVRGARRNGVTVDEIKELLLQTAIYCGVPAANAAFRIAQPVLDEESPGE